MAFGILSEKESTTVNRVRYCSPVGILSEKESTTVNRVRYCGIWNIVRERKHNSEQGKIL